MLTETERRISAAYLDHRETGWIDQSATVFANTFGTSVPYLLECARRHWPDRLAQIEAQEIAENGRKGGKGRGLVHRRDRRNKAYRRKTERGRWTN